MNIPIDVQGLIARLLPLNERWNLYATCKVYSSLRKQDLSIIKSGVELVHTGRPQSSCYLYMKTLNNVLGRGHYYFEKWNINIKYGEYLFSKANGPILHGLLELHRGNLIKNGHCDLSKATFIDHTMTGPSCPVGSPGPVGCQGRPKISVDFLQLKYQQKHQQRYENSRKRR